MKRSIILAALCALLASAVPVGAQAVLSIILLKDFKSNGTAVNWFHKAPAPRYIDFKGAPAQAVYNASTLTLEIGNQWAPYNPDGGFVDTKGARIGATSTRPTCVAGLRGLFWTSESTATGDAGVKDTTAQCCKAADGTYSWVAVACQ